MNPFRRVDENHRRDDAIREAKRVRDALDTSIRFYNVADGQIRSSQEIIDALTNLLELVQ